MRIIFIVIAVLIGINNIFINFKVGSISFERLMAFGFFFLFIKSYINELRTNKFFRTFNIFILVFAILRLIVNLKLAITVGLEFKYLLIGIIKSFSFVAFAFLILFIAKKDIKFLNYIIYAHLLIFVFALLQHPLSPIASNITDIKRLFYSAINDLDITTRINNQAIYISHGITDRFRLSGPFPSAIDLAYLLLMSFCLNIYMYFKLNKKFYFFSIVFILIVSVLTKTRSLLLAEAIIILGLMVFNYSEKRNLYKIVSVGLVFSVIILQISRQYSTNNQSSSRLKIDTQDVRPLLWYTGLVAIANHPFGITDKQYDYVRDRMALRYEHPQIGMMKPHFGFINIAFFYSIIGYVITILFFIFLIKSINQMQAKYRVIFLLFIFGYFVNTSFHNIFIFVDDYLIFIVLMILNLQLLHESNNSIITHE